MNLLTRLLGEAVKLCRALEIDYAVLGGLAVNLYGEPRFTADVDINILLEEEGLNVFINRAVKSGFHPACRNVRAFARKTGVIPMRFSKRGIIGRCDFIIAENALERAALKRSRAIKIGSLKARFISPEDLLIQKMVSSRARDAEDVRGILLRQKRRLDMAYIRSWLRKVDRVDKRSDSLKALNRFLNSI